MLADVDAGSDTPSLVAKVLKWRKDNDEQGSLSTSSSSIFSLKMTATALWTALDQLNQSLAQTLLHIAKLYSEDSSTYLSALKYISSLQPVQVIYFFSEWH